MYQEGDVVKSLTDLATTAYKLFRITNDSQWYIHNLNAGRKAFRLMKQTQAIKAIDFYFFIAKTGGILVQQERKLTSTVVKVCDELIDLLETNPEAKKHPDYLNIKTNVYTYRGESLRKGTNYHTPHSHTTRRRKRR